MSKRILFAGNTNMSSALRPSSFEGKTTPKMASHFLGYQPPRPEETSIKNNIISALPLPPRFALAFLGIFYPRREKPLVNSISMSEMDYGTVNASVEDDDVKGPYVSIDVDGLPLITYDEKVDEDELAMLKKWKGISCSDVISLVYLFIACFFMMLDFAAYFHAYWGVKKQTLHFVSYLTFLVQIMVVTYWCFYSRLRQCYHIIRQRSHKVSTISKAFIARRINIIRERSPDTKILSWFSLLLVIACAVTSGFLRIIYDYFFRICRSETAHIEMSHWTSLLGFCIYGSFCYVIYLERRSFEMEARQIYRYALEQAPFQNVDGVLHQIRLFNLQYRLVRKQVRKWMAFTIVVSTWGLTSHITWNYWVFSDSEVDDDILPAVYALNALVTTEKCTFILVPYAILGGLNIDHIWLRLKEDIAHCREHKHAKYWEAVVAYVKGINKRFSGDLTPTLVSSAIGVYLGLNLSKTQNLGFWNSVNGCNYTDHFFFG